MAKRQQSEESLKNIFAPIAKMSDAEFEAVIGPIKNKQRIVRQAQVAIKFVVSGQATVSEVAHLIGTSRQRVQKWVQRRYENLDIPEARRRYLQKLWEQAVAPIERKHKATIEFGPTPVNNKSKAKTGKPPVKGASKGKGLPLAEAKKFAEARHAKKVDYQ